MISVIIPVRNRPETLLRSIKSVLTQTIDDWELLVVENGSEKPVEISRVVERFLDKRIKFIDIGRVDNANIARNIGATYATGDVIAYLDSDDEFLPNHLQVYLQQLDLKKTMAVYGNFYIDDGFSRKATKFRSIDQLESAGDYLLGKGQTAQTSTFVIKKLVLEKVLWDNQLRRAQDIDFFIRLHNDFGWFFVKEPTVVVHWERGVKRNVDPSSYLQMFIKHKANISPSSRIRFLKSFYFVAPLYNASPYIRKSLKGYLLSEASLSWHLRLLICIPYLDIVVAQTKFILIRYVYRNLKRLRLCRT